MEPSLGWTLLSRDALRRAETQLRNDIQGVRDEVGFLALHQAYADRFFPGTSVQQTRLRYVLFVPWIYQSLIEHGVRERISDAVTEAEINLVGQLRQTGESGIIGTDNYPKPTSQPPCMVYWSALGTWRVLRPLADGSSPPRTVVHRAMGSLRRRSGLRDDDKQLMDEDEPLFVSLPKPPKKWQKKLEPLDFQLTSREKTFLVNQMIAVRRPDSPQTSLLSKLVESEIQLGPRAKMWSSSILQVADEPDRNAIRRAKQAAALSAIGRGVYAALVEQMREDMDGLTSGSRNRDAVVELIDEFAHAGLKLKIEDVLIDAPNMDTSILTVLNRTQAWLRRGDRHLEDLYSVYCDAESKRKGKRARLPKTLFAREKRLEWSPEKHPAAQPLHYRWNVARGFLRDLFAETGSGSGGGRHG